MVATRTFNISEVGLILLEANESKLILAKYPEAPACPTEE